jgi:hypothetical protein
MALARRPAAYLPLAVPGGGSPAPELAMARAARRRGWPAPVIYAEDDSGQAGPALSRLEAAIESGRHDALLMPPPPGLGDPAPLMRLLSRCTQHGVAVGLVLPPPPESDTAGPPSGPPLSPPSPEPSAVLARAGLSALAEMYPGWRIWLDAHGWHARRRSDGFLQGYQSGGQVFCVHAGTAPGLATQLFWQQAGRLPRPA